MQVTVIAGVGVRANLLGGIYLSFRQAIQEMSFVSLVIFDLDLDDCSLWWGP